MDRSKVGKLILLFLALPFAAYILIDCIAGYIPPTESYKKTPYQFEEAFNKQMAQYGMSIDIDSVNFAYGDDLKKVVPVVCEDGSKITCIYYPTSERRKALINYITFRQEITGKQDEPIYIVPLLAFLMDEFETGMTTNKDASFEPITSISYNEAIRVSEEFIRDTSLKKVFHIACAKRDETSVLLKRQTGEEASLSVSLYLW